ncbi:N-acetylmuramoyl-L-alanine amidase [Xylella taiwanensis]|uniref:N-acetylmuramoyl-L-alanine amidase n=1 Tax=Xylella taiwanensis TaxID=1444770 RepID=UPI001268A834|nr:N-acetylmuramoyl-L-alanine amidase [Xylella taiwanensis]
MDSECWQRNVFESVHIHLCLRLLLSAQVDFHRFRYFMWDWCLLLELWMISDGQGDWLVDSLPVVLVSWLVAIDPGYEGKSPGKLCKNNTYENHLTMAVAVCSCVYKYMAANSRYLPVVILIGDCLLRLHQCVVIVCCHKVDVFVLTHVDVALNHDAQGASEDVLFEDAVSSVITRWIASSENSGDNDSQCVQHSVQKPDGFFDKQHDPFWRVVRIQSAHAIPVASVAC